ncbi:MAG TPA: 3-oxoacyl-[acyl-carrier-protein] synthase III C-terminal domain-containing protein [Candidatus Dormibacteraeota bacterium]|nr:3-oxoacyl-[acyl-carrier-protein] synthase III C-terminal domain-containing protein [Candidatus Dormibacteraeota bacterium]
MTTTVPARRTSAAQRGSSDRGGVVRLAGLGTATPPRRVSREDVVEVLPRIWPQLARRTSLLVDPLDEGFRHLLREPAEMVEALSLGDQTARYAQAAPDLALAAAERAIASAGGRRDRIGLLVVASCTGFILPGLDAHLVPRLGLRPDVWRMPLLQLGCAGGAGGLARAADWVRTHPGEQALVVAVELPSLTFRPGDHSLDNLLSALVFGDGAGAIVLDGGGGTPTPGLRIGRVRSVLVPGSVDALGYDLADDGFRVILSRRLPAILASELPALVKDFRGGGGAAGLDAIALHPGGRAIVDAVKTCLMLSETQLTATRAVLRTTGNTSSAGIVFVLEELATSPPSPSGRGLIIGFGPGLTVELLELEWGC